MKQADREATGVVFSIQRYSLHDGEGIRTIVFLKGCALRCRFCSNPESQSARPELAFNTSKCLTLDTCTECLEVCEAGALVKGDSDRPTLDRALCDACMACVEACPSQALNVYGCTLSVAEVIAEVERDDVFYARSGGGMTLSGGEPMRQPEFALALLHEARRRHIDTAMETCGCCEWEPLAEACALLNALLFDVKHMDAERHRVFTGSSNVRILENLDRLCEAFPELPKRVRTPVIPGFNDRVEDIRAIADHLRGRPGVTYELLPYHRMGQPKYEYLGREYALVEAVLDEGVMARLNAVAVI
jgi:pyruvate formate lyase activating enzyme